MTSTNGKVNQEPRQVSSEKCDATYARVKLLKRIELLACFEFRI